MADFIDPYCESINVFILDEKTGGYNKDHFLSNFKYRDLLPVPTRIDGLCGEMIILEYGVVIKNGNYTEGLGNRKDYYRVRKVTWFNDKPIELFLKEGW
jgi:hypothetical protein